MKAIEILKEEAKKAGKHIEHEVLVDALELVKASLPRLAVEADEPAIKSVAGIALIVLPAIEPKIQEAIDKI